MNIHKIIEKKEFSILVECKVKDTNLGYLDSILLLCDELNIDVGEIKSMISSAIKSKLEAEAIELNYIKGGNKLPI